ncbi:30S ribosomal protein S19e [Candidatus Pacearchaeota archaeon CG_4_10_14_0_2_um_filter_35_33]|nr:40S ribosomal protein S19 [Candidatus Pacearchaeota archaeon]OIO43150.1 MAG: 30S ribosomal protein S19e [Candidatus Pacearchaeota archaeon CG1_02_35_32]PIY81593.1 MAG: 30S ribosomal protein S19e [Candidatus Pacearchaeota archaeon CG_4_10_14_0_8_um_filter_35_169]PIZ78968.1 MAG: 30S ribosomal protein S19e [Candidatus Pacearchaeota archaeon CG_4_10_14_0_2_um_filter_35_33]PJA69765.1 MAG: 30S ribosomal protein S19e [Candidatus Pacearchaeota archaeon CG_4_9_14_3_um_filter_35_19]PJB94232.1 MAG: 30
MADVRTIEAGKYNNLLAEALKKMEEFEEPEWVCLVKSGPHNSRPTNDENFWYKRAASVLRQIYLRGVVGVERLRTRYGGRKERGVKPSEFRKGGGKIIRTILQQAEKAGFIEKATGSKKGRQLTEKGKEFMEGVQ